MSSVTRFLTISSIQTDENTDSMGNLSYSSNNYYSTRNNLTGTFRDDLSILASNYYLSVNSRLWYNTNCIKRTYLSFYMDGSEIEQQEYIINAKISMHLTKSYIDFGAYQENPIFLSLNRDSEYVFHHIPIVSSDYYIGNYDLINIKSQESISDGETGNWKNFNLTEELINEIYNFGYFKYMVSTLMDIGRTGPEHNQTFSMEFSNYSDSSNIPILVLELINEEYTGLIETTSGRGQKCLKLLRE